MTPLSHLNRSPDRSATRLGAHLLPGGAGTRFRLWSTTTTLAHVRVDGTVYPMNALGHGTFEVVLPVGAGARYIFMLDGVDRPDPYARFLPDGVHGEAEVIDPDAYTWQTTGWRGLPLSECVFYELHVGTFTAEGTYRAAQDKLPYLKDLGVTAVQLMPVAAFPGQRGWGYDGVALYAPFAPYGRPEDLMAFVDAAHGLGLGVFLDVVYNHFGPDGNYLKSYSPAYFTDRFQSAWGEGLDYAEPHMRRLITGSARMWLRDYGFDGLRLDATPAMQDDSELHILGELAQDVHQLGGTHLLLAEDHRNDPMLLTEYGLDGIWADDFHHEVRVTLTREHEGYYRGFEGGAAELAQVIRRGWKYEGQFWNVTGERHQRGKPADLVEAPSLVYCIQNHDQIGNRAVGDRLHHHPDVTPQEYRGAATLLMTLPMTPLLFQGQEWAADTPFLFFSDHHGELGRMVSEGRKKEFAYFSGFAGASVPDPQAEDSFLASKLDWTELERGDHARTLALYRTLAHLRRDDPVLSQRSRTNLHAGNVLDVLWVRTRTDAGERLLVWNLGQEDAALDALKLDLPAQVMLHSEVGVTDALPRPGTLGPGEAALFQGGTP
ncbi:maltooligosyltrehalose trehalohydrolase [Deinococcus metalli]|uniref:Malto-oligosyltrehalose trehalohydrolase n=1 Tax=Deinococcus metalli TaxID=1141878 RepID=A0A7W8KHT8_9DEIO|nr:malto-oligosyltrehalose trehalohydrolase [Deinococcus metalli]MBB5377281.1 maltooligosyltrehalose trehalohydrolase [Deinococcus metalli]GHF47656.1 malto-oligosyltrehalose trehalohydrolase [Deinococcus metalli]